MLTELKRRGNCLIPNRKKNKVEFYYHHHKVICKTHPFELLGRLEGRRW